MRSAGGAAAQGVGPALHGPAAFLRRAHGEPGLDLDTAGGFRRGRGVVALAGVGLDVEGLVGRDRQGVREPLLQLGEPGDVAVAGRLGGARGLLEPGRLGRRPSGPSRRVRPAGPATAASAASDSCSAASAVSTSTRRSTSSARAVVGLGPQPFDAGAGVRGPGRGLVGRGLHLQRARCADAEPPLTAHRSTTSPPRVTARSSGRPASTAAAVARSSTHTTPVRAWASAARTDAAGVTTSSAHRGPRPVGAGSAGAGVGDVGAPRRRPRARPGRRRARAGARPRARHRRPSPTATASASGPSAAGDRGLPARLDREQRGHRAEHAAEVVGRREQRAAAVLAGRPRARASARADQVDRSFSAVGERPRPAASTRARAASNAASAASCRSSSPTSPTSRSPASAWTRSASDSTRRGPLPGGLGAVGEPGDLVVRGGGAGAQRLHLPGECREALAPVGHGARRGPQRRLGLRQRGVGAGAHRDGGGQGVAQGREFGGQFGLTGGDGVRLGLQRLGVGPGRDLRRARRRGGGRARRRGSRSRARARRGGDSVSQTCWAWARCGALRGELGLQGRDAGVEVGDLAFGPGPPFADDVLVGAVAVDLRRQGREVVGEQPQPGVAQVGLHAGGAARGLGLPAERAELAAQLRGEVGDAGEVGLHRVELAERLLLALAVFQDAGGLLDEAAAVLGAGLQHRVEPTLADDDVHLAADAGVGQQLLDVEQSGRVPVDLVLARAVAEHPPGDRDLGVVDRAGRRRRC